MATTPGPYVGVDMGSWATIIAYLIRWWDRMRIKLSYKKGRKDAALEGRQDIQDIHDKLDKLDDANPDSVPDSAVIRADED